MPFTVAAAVRSPLLSSGLSPRRRPLVGVGVDHQMEPRTGTGHSNSRTCRCTEWLVGPLPAGSSIYKCRCQRNASSGHLTGKSGPRGADGAADADLIIGSVSPIENDPDQRNSSSSIRRRRGPRGCPRPHRLLPLGPCATPPAQFLARGAAVRRPNSQVRMCWAPPAGDHRGRIPLPDDEDHVAPRRRSLRACS